MRLTNGSKDVKLVSYKMNMGIVDWFTNDLSTEERTLTRDLLSVAIADHEFSEEEQKTILEICETEDISLVETMDWLSSTIL